jgi:phenol 2-monooxygenase
MEGDSSDAVWGVMDVHPRTNFPDIRRKVTIHSNAGALVIIPREGEQLVRFYIQMPAMTDPKTVRLEELQANAKAILQGFKLEFAGTMWWSAYTIGQRLASTFSSPDGRILLAGDACHTHSPKAGQGMNVSLQDGYNVGWKLAQILNGHLDPSILSTYVTERHQVASDLIDFDRELTKFYHDAEHDPTAAERFKENFIKNARYMAGLTARYRDTILTNAAESSEAIAKNIKVGMRFPSAKVIRHCDAQVLEFQKVLQSDNKWRIVVFSGDIQDSSLFKRLQKVCVLGRSQMR